MFVGDRTTASTSQAGCLHLKDAEFIPSRNSDVRRSSRLVAVLLLIRHDLAARRDAAPCSPTTYNKAINDVRLRPRSAPSESFISSIRFIRVTYMYDDDQYGRHR